MPTFTYTARALNGELKTATMDAGTRDDVVAALRKQRMNVVKIDEQKAKKSAFGQPGITIRDNRSVCAHAGYCTDGLAKVFKYGSEPWIDPAGARSVQCMPVSLDRAVNGFLAKNHAAPTAPAGAA